MARKKADAKTESVDNKKQKETTRKPRKKDTTDKEATAAELAEVKEAEMVGDVGKKKRGGVGVNGNCIPFNQRTESENREIWHNAGVKSGQARRAKKSLRELTQGFLAQDANKTLKANMRVLGVEDEDMTNLAAIVARLFNKAVNSGDLQAARTLIEWAGMAPLQEMQENAAVAKLSQAMQLAGGGLPENADTEDVIFYIPDNQRPIIMDDDLVMVGEEIE